MSHKEIRLVPSCEEVAAQPATETLAELDADVRSNVESQFRQMEQTHDRIRAEELTARLAEPTIS